MATDDKAVASDANSDLTEDESKELEKLMKSVVHKRKTVPMKCMKIYREIVRHEIERLQNTDIKLEETPDKQKFMALAHKLRRSKRAKISFDDLHKAEQRILKCHERLKEINFYLKKQKEYAK